MSFYKKKGGNVFIMFLDFMLF